jgi:HEAT repeat protein
LDDERRIEPLVEALKDTNAEVVKSSLIALRKSMDARVGQGATRLLRHNDAAVRGMAALILEQHGWQPRDQDDVVWWYVARGQFSRAAARGSAAVPALERVIEQGPFSASVAAVQALAEVGGQQVLKPLFTALRSSEAVVCIAAIDTLRRLDRAEGKGPIQGMLKHREAHVRSAAAEACGLMPIPEAVAALQEVLQDPSWEVRRAAVEALGRLRDSRAVSDICGALGDKDEDVQQTAAMALGNARDRAAIPSLVHSLVSPTSGVRRLAAAALSRIDENWGATPEARAAAEEVRASLADTDPDARYFFQQLLGNRPVAPLAQRPPAAPTPLDREQRHKLAVNTLLSLLAEHDNVIRQAATEALGRLREKRAESSLARLIADPDPGVSAAATDALVLIQQS